jgi:predicted nuclease of predicted toxin-antitoxin system
VTAAQLVLRVFIDQCVPDSTGRAFQDHGHEVIYLREKIATNSPDPLVAAVAEANEAILVSLDADFRQLAKRHGVGRREFRRLSLIKLSCRESRCYARIVDAMSLILHE